MARSPIIVIRTTSDGKSTREFMNWKTFTNQFGLDYAEGLKKDFQNKKYLEEPLWMKARDDGIITFFPNGA